MRAVRRSTGDGRSEHEWRDGGGITRTDDVREAVSLRGKPSPHVNLTRDVTVYSVSIYSHVNSKGELEKEHSKSQEEYQQEMVSRSPGWRM